MSLKYINENKEEIIIAGMSAAIDSLPVGSGMDYYGTIAPTGYLFADGSAISRTEYAELFAIIGTTYGAGNGSTTFNLPDKRSRVSVMKDSGTFATLGGKGGAETVTLTTAQMPSHTHIQNAHTHNITGRFGATSGTNNATFAIGSTSNTTNYTHASGSTTAVNQNTGGGEAHNNLQPYLVCNYIIKAKSVTSSTSAILSALKGEY